MAYRAQRFQLSMEMIDFQRDGFGRALEALFTEFTQWLDNNYLMLTGAKAQNSGYPEKIQALVFARTGLSILLNVDTNELAATMPLWVNKHHVLLDAMWHGGFRIEDQELWVKEYVGKKGTIDLKGARVGGIFSMYKHGFWFDIITQHQIYKLTPAEMTGVFLHEIGHAFTTLEFSDRLETTNQVMQNLSRTLKQNGGQVERAYFFETLGEALCRNKTAFSEFEFAKPGVSTTTALIKRLFEKVQSQQEEGIYDETSSEQLADQFAARFGYGKHIVTGLHKLHLYYNIPEVSRSVRVYINLTQIILLFVTVLSVYAAILGVAWGRFDLVFYAMVYIGLVFLLIYGLSEKNADYTYDTVKARFTRIRHQYIEMLSHTQLGKTELRDALDAIKEMDRIIERTAEFRSLFQVVGTFFSMRSRAVLNDVRLQKLVEELAHNTLFIKSAELKTLL